MTATPTLREALAALLDHYTALVNSGDAGNWNPEAERVVIDARASLAQPAELTDAHLLDMAAEAETPAWGEWFNDEDALLRFARAVRAA